MIQKDVRIGSVYDVLVSGTIQPVRVSGTFAYATRNGDRTGWICVNLNTNRQIKVRSAQKFRRLLPTRN